MGIPLFLCSSLPGAAQELPAAPTTQPPITPFETTQQALDELKQEISQGRLLLDSGDAQARPALRACAQRALKLVLEDVAADALTTRAALPRTGVAGDILRQASEAHLLWGLSADRFGGPTSRDEAITAWARALKLAGDDQFGANIPAADARFRLAAALRQGLPQLATDDALQTIAENVHGGLWTPHRFTFDASTLHLEPGAATSSASSAGAHELLVTSGKLFPPAMNERGEGAELARVPPFYRVVAPAALPPSLRLDRLAIGYAREVTGPNRGLWRQAVRVFYASPYLTRNHRDDSARAEALCAQFLKVHTLLENALGVENPHTRDGVTTLWLLEISARWPDDDQDPLVQAQLGLHTPKINTPTERGGEIKRQVEITPYEMPWRAAGQTAAAPGEVMFYRVAEPRSEAEWLRQISHEYGHVALPPFTGFAPPLEPFGNGKLGETLALLWAAQLPPAQLLPPVFNDAAPDPAENARITRQLDGYLERELLPALQRWDASGPNSPLQQSGDEAGLEYLRGLAIYLERVYGARVLNAALQKLASAAGPDNAPRDATLQETALQNAAPEVLTAQSLLHAAGEVFRTAQWTELPIWLPGALEPSTLDAATLKARARATFKSGARPAWLYVPPGASTLRVAWRGAQPPRVAGDWKQTTIPPRAPGETGTLAIAVAGRPGWRHFTFETTTDIEITGARFQKTQP